MTDPGECSLGRNVVPGQGFHDVLLVDVDSDEGLQGLPVHKHGLIMHTVLNMVACMNYAGSPTITNSTLICAEKKD